MEDLGNTAEHVENALEPGGASESVEAVATDLEKAAEKARDAARDAATDSEHEVLSGVSQALGLLREELKRANDLREYEHRQATQAVGNASETATAPIAEVVPPPPAKRVRRGARKVKK